MTTAKKLLTAEEFALLPDDGHRRELIDGEVIELAPGNFRHGEIGGNVLVEISVFVRERGLGRVSTLDPGFTLRRDPDRVRAPDVAFIARDRLPPEEDLEHGFPEIVPDLVVEVVSPGDTATDVQEKVEEWLAAGVRLVLVLYPRTRTVMAHRGLNEAHRYGPADTLDAEPVLPGFACPVARLFE